MASYGVGSLLYQQANKPRFVLQVYAGHHWLIGIVTQETQMHVATPTYSIFCSVPL